MLSVDDCGYRRQLHPIIEANVQRDSGDIKFMRIFAGRGGSLERRRQTTVASCINTRAAYSRNLILFAVPVHRM